MAELRLKSCPRWRFRPSLASAMAGVAIVAMLMALIQWISTIPETWRLAARQAVYHARRQRDWEYMAAHAQEGQVFASSVLTKVSFRNAADAQSRHVCYEDKLVYIYCWGPLGQFERSELSPLELSNLCRAKAAYHGRLKEKWAWVRWLPLSRPGPDPPGPPIIDGGQNPSGTF